MRKIFILLTVLFLANNAGAQSEDYAFDITITYVTRDYDVPLPLSLLEKPVEDAGLMGARLANQENQLTGRLMKQKYSLQEFILPSDSPPTPFFQDMLRKSAGFIVADLEMQDLLILADLPEAENVIIFNIRAKDDVLRREICRKSVYHIAPSWAMKADGLAQYLIWKRWDKWLLLHGKGQDDVAYAQAFEKSAKKFGAKIISTLEYQFEAGSRRVESGHQQVQTQMNELTMGVPEYDVLVVSDVGENFGDYLPYRLHDPRPVVGTHGLSAKAWQRAFEQFGSMSLHSAFKKLAARPITDQDYLGWLGVKAFSEAALRTSSADKKIIREFIDGPDYIVPGFKGIGMNFRTWNQQLRQPILIAWERALVSMSPQDEFLHRRNPLDSLGGDLQESECQLNEGE